MAKSLAIGFGLLLLLALLLVLAAFIHGLYARYQMKRYQRIAADLSHPARKPRLPSGVREEPVNSTDAGD